MCASIVLSTVQFNKLTHKITAIIYKMITACQACLALSKLHGPICLTLKVVLQVRTIIFLILIRLQMHPGPSVS